VCKPVDDCLKDLLGCVGDTVKNPPLAPLSTRAPVGGLLP
jgi:hypothetical protein